MLLRKGLWFGSAAVLAVIAISLFVVSQTPSMRTEGAVGDAVDAYIYGYPLVTLWRRAT